jgi:hypothetical protein
MMETPPGWQAGVIQTREVTECKRTERKERGHGRPIPGTPERPHATSGFSPQRCLNVTNSNEAPSTPHSFRPPQTVDGARRNMLVFLNCYGPLDQVTSNCVPDEFGSRFDAELTHHFILVGFRSPRRDSQNRGDFFHGLAFGE